LDDYALEVAKTSQERAREAREAKLEHIREQVSSGELVVRSMTDAERAKWAERQAGWTPEERARHDAAVEHRRRRSAPVRDKPPR